MSADLPVPIAAVLGLVITLCGCAKSAAPVPAPSASSAPASASASATPANVPVADAEEARPRAIIVPPECASVDLAARREPCVVYDRRYAALLRAGDPAPVALRVSVDQPLKVGAPIAVTATYVNESDQPVAVQLAAGGDPFEFTLLDKDGEPADAPRGRSPCCGPPDKPTIVCNGTPVVDSYSLVMPSAMTLVLSPRGTAFYKKTWTLRRRKWGPVAKHCERVEIGPVPAGAYVLEARPPLEIGKPAGEALRVPVDIVR